MQIITELHCFGNIRYWAALVQANRILIEKQERFQKSGYRNRYEILSATGPLLLTIPVEGGRETNELFTATCIKNSKPWQQQHWRALESCYNHSPFFLYYADRLKPLFTQPYTSLFDWNIAALQWVASQLKFSLTTEFTSSFIKAPDPSILDLRNKFKPGNRDFHTDSFERYIQVFGTNFHSNLSVLDAIFNLGGATLGYLQSQKVF